MCCAFAQCSQAQCLKASAPTSGNRSSGTITNIHKTFTPWIKGMHMDTKATYHWFLSKIKTYLKEFKEITLTGYI